MKRLFVVLTLTACAFFTVPANAASPEKVGPALNINNPEPVSVFVHISALKAGKDGFKVAKITQISLAKGQQPGKGKFRAKLRQEGNLLQFEIQLKNRKFDKLIMPEGFVLSDRISKLLGASKSVVMSGGSTMLKPTESRLQFEIQM